VLQRSIDAGVSSRPPCRFEVLRVCWDPRAATASLETLPSPGSGGLKACAVVLDVGHNPPALAELAKMLARRFGGQPLRLVLGMSRDKDLGESLKLALRQPLVKHVHLVAAPHPRAAPPSQLLKAAQASADHANRRDPDNFFSVHEGAPGSVARGVRAAVAAAAGRGEVVVVCGSVFVMAEAREALGFKEPRDTPCIDEMAGSNTRSAAEHAASSASP
jgi:dihydrofolate synthase/folylpolyglutamate synthase